MKLAFRNVPFRRKPTCVIQKQLRFKKAITARLAYMSHIFPDGSKIIQKSFSKSGILVKLLKTEVLYSN